MMPTDPAPRPLDSTWLLAVTCSCGATAGLRPADRLGGRFECSDRRWTYHSDEDINGVRLETSRLWYCGEEGHRQAGCVERIKLEEQPK